MIHSFTKFYFADIADCIKRFPDSEKFFDAYTHAPWYERIAAYLHTRPEHYTWDLNPNDGDMDVWELIM